jgi:hypothetical protein
MSNVAPLSLLSSVVVLDDSADSWPMLDPSLGDKREFRKPIRFEQTFSHPPVVQVGLVGIDASKDDNLRLRLRAEAITSSGFTLHAETWLNTKIWSIEVSWLAIGS